MVAYLRLTLISTASIIKAATISFGKEKKQASVDVRLSATSMINFHLSLYQATQSVLLFKYVFF